MHSPHEVSWLISDTLHHNDAEANKFWLARWLDGKRSASEKHFILFSYACVGRNVAMMDPKYETVLSESFLSNLQNCGFK
jgi:hypothetical protein